VAATVEVCTSPEEAAAQAATWLAARGARRIVAWDDPDVAAVVARLASDGFEVLPPGTPVEVVAQADAGLTGAAWGVAESASLALPADPRRPRLFSLLPPLHVAVLPADRILPDLPALFERLAAEAVTGTAGPAAARPGVGANRTLPSALTLITGPSRSADIGLVPVQGAHGPVDVAVFVVRPDAAGGNGTRPGPSHTSARPSPEAVGASAHSGGVNRPSTAVHPPSTTSSDPVT
jgi:L-lactate dehydrogenase complex protein LldG